MAICVTGAASHCAPLHTRSTIWRHDATTTTLSSYHTMKEARHFAWNNHLHKNMTFRYDEPRGFSVTSGVCPVLASTKSDEYNRIMQRQMRNPYEYHHDLGIYYTRIIDDLIVGSQPQTPQDIDKLFKDEGVRAILNLQQDKDIEYWGINVASIIQRCMELDIQYMRSPVGLFTWLGQRF
ncbi:hypothetical protein KP509_34G038300 [Ceratopteris richardii]|uniref:Uncharacterized protein n=2 Tax=Ceratopteris richardii TaxID=49495 RepID=A0A8T2QKY1_CERRI|nr:hypothetical protein KP509_34G038300 [Ceratopteris richardii]